MNMHDALKKAGVAPPPPKGTYFDEHGNLRLEFVTKKTIGPLLERFKADRPELKMSQLRAFFGYCREVERRLKAGESTWEAERPRIAMLSAYAAYRASKKDPTIPRSFQRFIDENVEKIRGEDDFLKGFMQYFEALLGFAPLKLK